MNPIYRDLLVGGFWAVLFTGALFVYLYFRYS